MQENYQPIELPSKCLLYDGIDPSAVKIRTLKGKDEKIMAEISNVNFEKKLCQVLGNVLQGIKPEQLTLGDRMFIILWEAINTFGNDYPVDTYCIDCDSKIIIEVDLSVIEVKTLDDGISEPFQIQIENGSSIGVRLFRVEDEIKIYDFEKNGKSSFGYRYALTLVDDRDIIQREEFLDNLSAKDVAKIRAVQEKYTHGPIMEQTYACPKCGGSGRLTIPFQLELIFPYGKTLERYYGETV